MFIEASSAYLYFSPVSLHASIIGEYYDRIAELEANYIARLAQWQADQRKEEFEIIMAMMAELV